MAPRQTILPGVLRLPDRTSDQPVILARIRPVRPWCGRPVSAVLRLAAGLLAAPIPPLAAQSIAEVQVTPETMTLGVNQRQTLFAAAYDRQGNLVPSAKFAFWSSDTLIARVMRNGTVVGVGPGLAKVEARVQGRRASMAVLITPAKGDSVPVPPGTVLTLSPSALALLPGERASLSAQALAEDGSPVSAGRIGWKSLAPEIAAVESDGGVIGVAPGRTIVQALVSAGLTATAPVTVEATEFAVSRPRLTLGPEETDTLRVVVPSQGDRPVRSGIQWSSSDTAIVQVGPSGMITARAPGQATVTASGFAQQQRATVTVHRVPQALMVSPPAAAGPIQLPVRGVQQHSAVAEAADSTPIPEARLEWAVGDTSVAVFDAAARTLTGKAVGNTTLTVRLRGFQPVVWTVNVIPGLLAMDRPLAGLAVGARDTLSALLTDEAGKAVGSASRLAWTSDRQEVVRVSGYGVIDGLSPGRATVTAKAPWGRSASADVVVTSDLVVASNRSGHFGLYQLRAAAGEGLLPILVDSASNLQPALSPDRTRIAFSSNRSGSFDIFVMEADGRNLVRVTRGAGNEGDPVWTPDGARIVYTATLSGGLTQVHSVAADGRDDRALTASPGGNHSADVSPDGRSIVFVSARDGNQDIYVMPAAGGEASRITRTPARESHPHFLPGGELLFVTDAGGRSRGSRIVRSAPGGQPVVLLHTEQPVTSLDLSRDGTRVAYVLGRLTDPARGRGQFSLYTQTLAGGRAEQIPLRPGEQAVSPSF